MISDVHIFCKFRLSRSTFLECSKQIPKFSSNTHDFSQGMQKFDKLINETDDRILYYVVRTLHVKNHLKELDYESNRVENAPPSSQTSDEASQILDSKLVLQCFLDYLRQHGPGNSLSFTSKRNQNLSFIICSVADEYMLTLFREVRGLREHYYNPVGFHCASE